MVSQQKIGRARENSRQVKHDLPDNRGNADNRDFHVHYKQKPSDPFGQTEDVVGGQVGKPPSDNNVTYDNCYDAGGPGGDLPTESLLDGRKKLC